MGEEGIPMFSSTLEKDPSKRKSEVIKQIDQVNLKLEEEMNLTDVHQHIYDRTNKELWCVKEKLNEVEVAIDKNYIT